MSLIKEAKPLETEYLVIDPVDIFKELKRTNFEDIPSKLSSLSNVLTTELQDEARFNGANSNFCIKLGLSGSQGIKITVTEALDNKKIAESDTSSEIGYGWLLVKIIPSKIDKNNYMSNGKIEFYKSHSRFVFASSSINKRTNQIVGNNTIFKLV